MKTYKQGDKYWFLNEFMEIRMTKWKGRQRDYSRQQAYNCFEFRNGVVEAQFELKNLLRQYNETNN
jgi:hypothetical protein